MAEENEENEELYRFLIDGLADGVLVVDSGLSITFANRGIRKQFRLTADPVGMPMIQAVLDHRLVNLVQESVKRGEKVKGEIFLANVSGNGGKERLLSLTASPLNRSDEGGALGEGAE
ncbi:MAG: PAS domain-containing protein [Verrucomicrobiota bacterium]